MHMSLSAALALPAALLVLASCGTPESSASQAPGAAVAQQFKHGATVYGSRCARCHGDAGEGSRKAPPLVGADALPLMPRPDQVRKRPFHTALDIAQFVTQAMPPDEDVRAEMAQDDYWAVLAFALTANGVVLEQPVSPDNAAAIVLHP